MLPRGPHHNCGCIMSLWTLVSLFQLDSPVVSRECTLSTHRGPLGLNSTTSSHQHIYPTHPAASPLLYERQNIVFHSGSDVKSFSFVWNYFYWKDYNIICTNPEGHCTSRTALLWDNTNGDFLGDKGYQYIAFKGIWLYKSLELKSECYVTRELQLEPNWNKCESRKLKWLTRTKQKALIITISPIQNK